MSKLPQDSRGFSNASSGFKGFKTMGMGPYFKPKDKQMSDCDEGERKGDTAYTRSFPLPAPPEKPSEEEMIRLEDFRKAIQDGPPSPSTSIKDTNPKDAVGVRKSPISTVSAAVMAELGLAMLEGARKYGRHNYRVSGVRASVYWDALFRHLMAWWDFSQDDDPDSGLPHIVKAMACLCVLRDAQHLDNWVDDRPPPLPIELLKKFNKLAEDIIDRHPDAKEPFTNKDTK